MSSVGCISHTHSLVSCKHVICTVGLPARGKTYISKKLCRYLTWLGVRCKVYNVGEYRRKATKDYHNHQFFKHDNKKAMDLREKVADDALDDALEWLKSSGDVVIFDATNVTVNRRNTVYNKVVKQNNFKCLFIESVCEQKDIISSNITEVKIHGPDYEGCEDKEKAIEDFKQRILHYEEIYQTITDELEGHLSYMKVINAGEKLVLSRHSGNLQSRIGYWLMNIHITPRTIYLTRHGESELNLVGKIGGDCNLSPRGQQYAQALAKHINGMKIPNLQVWTSFLKRTIQTAAGIETSAQQERWKALNEIDAGICEEMTYQEIESKFPADFKAREQNKLGYRYPGGESYEDLVIRLEAVIMELERQENVLVVGHQAILRCILCYFMDKPLEEMPYVKVPLHTLIKISPMAYGCDIEMFPMGVEAVDTHRPKLP